MLGCTYPHTDAAAAAGVVVVVAVAADILAHGDLHEVDRVLSAHTALLPPRSPRAGTPLHSPAGVDHLQSVLFPVKQRSDPWADLFVWMEVEKYTEVTSVDYAALQAMLQQTAPPSPAGGSS